ALWKSRLLRGRTTGRRHHVAYKLRDHGNFTVRREGDRGTGTEGHRPALIHIDLIQVWGPPHVGIPASVNEETERVSASRSVSAQSKSVSLLWPDLASRASRGIGGDISSRG